MPQHTPSPTEAQALPAADVRALQALPATDGQVALLGEVLPPPAVEGQIPPERFARLKTVGNAVVGFARWAERTLPPAAAGLHELGVFGHLEARAPVVGGRTGKVMSVAARVGGTLADYHRLKNN